jgi:hypothetical protein
MSQVRVPKSAEVILPFCRPWHDRHGSACFDSYADMVVFAAGLGFSKVGKNRPQGVSDFLDQPYPISIDVFKNQHLYPVLLLLSFAVIESSQIARDEKRICGILEDYAEVGFLALKKLLSDTTAQEFHIELGRLILETSSKGLQI